MKALTWCRLGIPGIVLGLGILASLAQPSWARRQATPLVVDAMPSRVVAIGDVHGTLEGLRSILREAALIDDADRWVGGDTTLVQTGDLFDRGTDVFEVVELLRDLQSQAAEAGGRVVVLLGNHETMNLMMDLRDVNPEIFPRLVDKKSERRRASLCRRQRTMEMERAEKAGQEAPDRGVVEDRCLTETPLGFLEYLVALGPDGEAGRWLRELPALVRVGSWLFVHGGLSPVMAGLEIEAIDQRIHAEIEAFDRMRRDLLARGLIVETSGLEEIVAVARGLEVAVQRRGKAISSPSVEELQAFLGVGNWWIVSGQGPLWFRGYARSEGEELLALVNVLETVGAERAVAGHTPRKSRSIEPRGEGRFFLIDTGMLERVYRGRPSALEISSAGVNALYPDQEPVVLLDFEQTSAAASSR